MIRDLVVIGAGSAGLSAATFAARLGATVTLVERDRVGGDCTWTGCVPSKTLIGAAGLASAMRHADAFGLPPSEPSVDLGTVLDHVRSVVHRVYAAESPDVLARRGIEVIRGEATFVDPHTLAVDGTKIRARRFILCTGARPVIPAIEGLAGIPAVTYETVFDLKMLPRALIVLGGGAIGVELGQAFRRLGSGVTMIEQEPRLLPLAEAEASAVLAARLREEGVRLATGLRVERVTMQGDMVTLWAGATVVTGDTLLVALGRRPVLDRLGLDRAGIAVGDHGIRVDPWLRTSQRHVYAAGDVTGSHQFTHYAGWQGVVAARNALLPGWRRGVPETVPWVVFSDPEIAQVGLTEHEARARGSRIEVERWPLERIDRAQTLGDHVGFVKLVAGRGGRLVGATVVARMAGEVVNHLALALGRRHTLKGLATTMLAYPTYGIAIQQAAGEATIARYTRGWRGTLLRRLVRLR